MSLSEVEDLDVSHVLTRTTIDERTDFPRPDLLTNDLVTLLDASDVVVECSGDVLHATRVVDEALQAGLPVVTMNSEFHVTTGSYFLDRGLLTEAAGDQPGALAALKEDVVQMGFEPLVYGNIKRFLNRNPEREEMRFWAKKQGISLPQVTAFTDGTKVQIEQAFVANGLDATIAVNGLIGIESQDVHEGARTLADGARRLSSPLSDYVLSSNAPAGVFIAATHDDNQREYLQYLKMGDGPYYILQRNYHLCHLEIAKTIRRICKGQGPLLTNSRSPKISVCTIAKSDCQPGDEIERGIGNFTVRGEAVRIQDAPEHVPIGLMDGATIRREIRAGEMLTFDDVDLPDTKALRIWNTILDRVLKSDKHEEQPSQASISPENGRV